MATVGKLAVLLSANARGMTAGVRVGIRSLTSLGNVATTVNQKLLAVGGGLTLAVGLKKASDTANSFEKVMDDVGARLKTSDADLASLNARARELSASKPFKPFEAGAAMVELVKGGIEDIAAVKSISGDVLNLSGAENGLELARSAEIIVKSMAQFDLAASQSGAIVDSFAMVAGSAATDVDQLAHQLTAAAPGANALGKSLDETLALLGALSGPLGADQVGTAVRGMFNSMKSPSKQAKAELEDLGLTFFDMAGDIKPVTRIVDEFRDRLAGMTSEQKGATLGKLFEARAGNAFLALLNGADSKVAAIQAKLDGSSGGFAENLASAKLDNVTGSFDGFLSKLDNLSIGIFKPLESARKAFWSGLGDSIAKATPWVEKATTAVAGLLGNMGQLDWRPAIAIAGGMAAIVPAALTAKSAIIGVRIAGMLLAPVLPVVRALKFALLGFGPAASLAKASILGVVAAARGLQSISFRGIASSLATAFSSGVAGIAGLIGPLIGLLGAVALPIVGIGAAAGLAFLLTEDGTKGVKAAWSSVQRHSAGIFSQIQSVALAAFDVMLSGARAFLSMFGVEFDTTGSSVASGFAANMAKAGDWIEGALIDVEFFLNNFRSYFDLGLLHVAKFVTGVGADMSHLFVSDIPKLLGNMVSNFGIAFGNAASAAGSVFENIAQNAGDAFGEIWDYAKSFGEDPIEFNFTPLLEDFKGKAFEELELPARQIGELEKSLGTEIAALSKSLSVGKKAFSDKRQSELDAKNFQANALPDFQSFVDGLAVDGQGTLGEITDSELSGIGGALGEAAAGLAANPNADVLPGSAERESVGIVEKGSSAAYASISKAIKGSTDKDVKETAKNTANIAESVKQIADTEPVPFLVATI